MMNYELLENKDIFEKEGLKELASTLMTFNAEVVEVEEFNFNDGEKIYFSVYCRVPEYKGTQFDDGYKVSFTVPAFETVKVIEGVYKYEKYLWTVKEISVEEKEQFYRNIDSLANEESLAGETALPYYMGEESSFHYLNNIHKVWKGLFE